MLKIILKNMNQINKETKFFISISSRPSNFGTQVYNNIFKKFFIFNIHSYPLINSEQLFSITTSISSSLLEVCHFELN